MYLGTITNPIHSIDNIESKLIYKKESKLITILYEYK